MRHSRPNQLSRKHGIPDEWWLATGADGFTPSTHSYRGAGYSIESETLVHCGAAKRCLSGAHVRYLRELDCRESLKPA